MKTQRLSSDRITTLPESIIENILCLVPIKDAVSTSVLSREWRFRWTTIPKLVFSEYEFQVSTTLNHIQPRKCKLFYAIFQVLLVHQGPIHEFGLFINGDATCVEIDRIIAHLARNSTLKKFTLSFNFPRLYKMPLSFFSLHHLTDLNLFRCYIDFQPVSSRFSSLTRLCLIDVRISTKTLLHLFEEYNHMVSDDDSTLIELFKCLPMIEDLTISYWVFQCFVEDSYAQVLRRTSLNHLKYFRVEGMFFTGRNDLLFIISLMRCSPNLEKLKLQKYRQMYVDEENCWNSDIESITPEDYSDIWLYIRNSLALLGILLHLPRASPMVESMVKEL
uniref:F-box/FBD/LRR-repeat protein At1g13570-like n=1 Tax=Erigeron canadensis TaxID=72917 RepID=UPI001CB96A46|nr:F-box/FBD/LRR-repeat protein At1g13570-like [Erigeron canadensis]